MLAARRLVAYALTTFLLTWSARPVDYEPISLDCLIGAADTITLGRVSRDRAGKYWLTVDETVTGEKIGGRLRLLISPWQGPPARSPGRALLFLRRSQEGNFEVLGPSAEGWLPIAGKLVRIEGIAMPGKPGNVQRYELTALIDGLRGIARCVRWSRDTAHARVRATIVCNETALKSLRGTSMIAQQLVDAIIGAQESLPCLAVAPHPQSKVSSSQSSKEEEDQ
jgi:hypothetical protein